MATVTRENISNLHDKLNVTVSSTDYVENYNKSLKNYAKNANIQGFRKGMVPAGLVKKMYGQSVFTDEVLKAVEKSLFDYLDTEKLDIFAQPVAADATDANQLDQNNPKDYTFGFEIGLKPAIILPSLATAKLTKYKVTVTDEMVSEELSRLQKKHGELTEPETVDNEENVLNVTFTATTEGAEPKDNSLLVKYFTKTYQTKLQGAKKDDSFTFKLNEAFEGRELEFILSDLKVDATAADTEYTMAITKLGLVTPAVLDEKFFEAAFPGAEIKTEEAAKEQLKTEIESYWNNQAINQLQDGIYHVLVDDTTMEFPEAFLKKWMQTSRDKQYTAEEVEVEFPKFAQSLKWTLISDKINKDQGFKVEREEIKEFAKAQLFGYMGGNMSALGENTAWIDDYAEKMMKDKKFIEDTYHRVLTEKLFSWATTQVTPTEKAISVEDFTKLIEEHKHEH